MTKRIRELLLCATFLFGMSRFTDAQINLTGMVADSASMQALANVNILNKQSGKRTVSDIRGGFALEARAGDTIVFSRVGYYTKVLPAMTVKETVIVFLKEARRMLQPVEIGDKGMPSWLPQIEAQTPWKNAMYDQRTTDIPGFQGIQTFGLGYVFRMPGSGFNKEARAKQKLDDVREENAKGRDYIHLVNSPEIKGKIIKDYQITEDEYYRLLAVFNERNKDFIYKLESHEVIPLLIQFYAESTKTKSLHK